MSQKRSLKFYLAAFFYALKVDYGEDIGKATGHREVNKKRGCIFRFRIFQWFLLVGYFTRMEGLN